MRQRFISILFISIITGAIFVSCSTDDPFRIPPPNFDSVPPPQSIAGMTPVQIEPGVEAYIHEEGYGEFFVTNRDNVEAFVTLRTDDGTIIFSSFANNRQEPSLVSMRFAGSIQNDFNFSVSLAYSPGFKAGLLGMKLGESRTLVVSPEKGFGSAPSGFVNAQYRENTLYYEVRISRIFPD